MFSRHDIPDDHWERIRNLLPGQSGGHGGVGDDTRLFVNVIRYLAKTGIAWADLPMSAGKPTACGSGTTAGASAACGSGWRPNCGTTTPRGRSSTAVASAPARAPPARKKKGTGAAVNRPRRWAAGAADSARNGTPR